MQLQHPVFPPPTFVSHLILDHKTPKRYHPQYKQNDLSWSEIAHNFGLEPANVGKLLYSEDEPKR